MGNKSRKIFVRCLSPNCKNKKQKFLTIVNEDINFECQQFVGHHLE